MWMSHKRIDIVIDVLTTEDRATRRERILALSECITILAEEIRDQLTYGEEDEG